MKELRLYYDGDGVNRELDKDIERLLRKYGLLRCGSGYHLIDKKRDLCFVKKEV
jgi:hypothetical protein